MLYVLLPLLFVWAGWPIVKRVDPVVGDTWYRVRRQYRLTEGKSPTERIKRLVYGYLEAVIPASWLAPFDRILVLSGQAGKRRALDVLLIQAGMLAIVIFLAVWAKHTPTWFILLYGFLVMVIPWRRWYRRIQARRRDAAWQVRQLKRRFVSLLRRRIPLEEALWQIAKDAAAQRTDFGRRFVARMQEARVRALGDALHDLAEEFRVPELTRFVQAIRHAEANSLGSLADILETQIRDESAQLDELVDAEKNAMQLKLRMMSVVMFVYILGWAGYFAFAVFRHQIKTGQGILGLF